MIKIISTKEYSELKESAKKYWKITNYEVTRKRFEDMMTDSQRLFSEERRKRQNAEIEFEMRIKDRKKVVFFDRLKELLSEIKREI